MKSVFRVLILADDLARFLLRGVRVSAYLSKPNLGVVGLIGDMLNGASCCAVDTRTPSSGPRRLDTKSISPLCTFGPTLRLIICVNYTLYIYIYIYLHAHAAYWC